MVTIYSVVFPDTKNSLDTCIQQEIKVLCAQIDINTHAIAIHLNTNYRDDYPRMCFILFSLSNAYKHGYISEIQKNQLVLLFWKIYSDSLVMLDAEQFEYVDLYGIRFLHNMSENLTRLIDHFSMQEYSRLYTDPIRMSIFMHAYEECPLLREKFTYSQAIYNTCCNTLHFILNSNIRNNYEPFYFAELQDLRMLDSVTKQKAHHVILKKFKDHYLQEQATSSGAASCLEHFVQVPDSSILEDIFLFLSQRKLSHFGVYIRAEYIENSTVLITENTDSQYVCLDTHAHLLNAYLLYSSVLKK